MIANSSFISAVAALPLALSLPQCGPTNEFVEPPPQQVTVALPEVKAVEVYDEFPGRTSALASVEVRARVKGFLEKVVMKPSTIVKVGAPLFLIEQPPFEAKVLSAQGQLEAAEAASALARNAFERKDQALKSGGVSALDRDAAKADMDAAVANVTIAKANLTQAEIDFAYTDIRAPVEGRLSRSLVDMGNLVGGTEGTLLTTIVDDSKLYADFEVTEREALAFLGNRPTIAEPGKTRPDFVVKLLLSDGSEYSETGKIDYLDNTVDPATGTIKARAEFPNAEGKLAAGMFVRVLIPQSRQEGGKVKERVLIPSLAIQRDIGGDFVLVVGEGDVVELRRVKAGRLLGEERIIDEGLEGTERIVVKGLQIARDGVKVAPVMAGEEKAAAKGE